MPSSDKCRFTGRVFLGADDVYQYHENDLDQLWIEMWNCIEQNYGEDECGAYDALQILREERRRVPIHQRRRANTGGICVSVQEVPAESNLVCIESEENYFRK